MNRGNGRQLAGLGVGAVVLLGVALLSLQFMGRADSYAQAASGMADIERVQLDAFLGCVFPSYRPAKLGAEQVSASLQRIVESRGKSYATTFQTCQPKLQALSGSLEALQVPDDLGPEHAKLVAATGALAAANTAYLTYLSAAEREYDPATALPMVQAFGEASAGYDAAQKELQLALVAKL